MRLPTEELSQGLSLILYHSFRAGFPSGKPAKGGRKMEELVTLIANVGFPIAVTVYLLVIFGNKLDRLSDAVESLAKYIEGLSK